jgi:hypothetical protein
VFSKRGPSISLVDYFLLLLAVCVFGWGLQAKIALYQNDSGHSELQNSAVKLSTERDSDRTVCSMGEHGRPRHTWESLEFAALAFSMQGHLISAANLFRVEPGPPSPGRYSSHDADPWRRPPPVLS